MRPTKFTWDELGQLGGSARHCNVAEDQPEYETVIAAVQPEHRDGPVTTRWVLSWRERLHVLLGRPIFLTQLTFGRGMQPILLGTSAKAVRP